MRRQSQLIIIALTLSGVITTVITILVNEVTNVATPLPLWVAVPLLVFAVGVGITIGVWLYRLQNSTSTIQKQKRKRRKRMLVRVQTWVIDHLAAFLHGATLITPGLSEQPGLVLNPWGDDVQELSRPAHPLPSNTHILEVYNSANGELLILGEPGSGKTTLLLDLARDLLEPAFHDDDLPIPVVFNLSSWVTRQPLVDWLVEELHKNYQVLPEIGRPWVDNDQILPILDGLDEVGPAYRALCAEAINAYRGDHGLVPTVVTCRMAEYKALGQDHRLRLRKAVVIYPFTPEQIGAYLAHPGEQVGAVRMALLRVALRDDPELQKLASNPLLLSMIAQAYHEKPIEDLPKGSPDERRRQIFEMYVQNTFESSGEKTRYTQMQTRGWLTWLARQMTRHGRTEFYIERLQPDWLPNAGSQRLYRGITTAVLIELFCGIAAFLAGGVPGIYFGLLVGVLICLLNILLNIVLPSTRPRLRSLSKFVCFGLFGGLNFASLTILVIGLLHGQNVGLTNGPIFGIMVGAFGLFVDKLAGEPDMKVELAEVVDWSWPKMRAILASFLSLGLAGGLIFALFFGTADGRFARIILGVFFGLLLGLFFGLIGGWERGELEEKKRISPNQGIWYSARNGVRTGLLAGPAIGLLLGLFLGVVTALVIHANPGALFGIVLQSDYPGVPAWLEFGIIVGLSLGGFSGIFTVLVAALFGGWSAWIKHFTLRFLLWCNGCMPWRYSRFLDYAAEQRLLFKVGGGYEFVHRLLRDYFASFNLAATPATYPIIPNREHPYNASHQPQPLRSPTPLQLVGTPPPKSHGRASITYTIVTLMIILVCIGISVVVFQGLKHGLDTALLRANATATESANLCASSTRTTPPVSGRQDTSPSGLPVDPAAAAIISNIRTASAIDSNYCPTKLASIFRVNQTIYVIFIPHLQGKTGYVEIKWYLDNQFGPPRIDPLNDPTALNDYYAAPYTTQGKGAVELYWCTKSDCSDARLAGFVTFTVT